jgi:hypothetical protein
LSFSVVSLGLASVIFSLEFHDLGKFQSIALLLIRGHGNLNATTPGVTIAQRADSFLTGEIGEAPTIVSCDPNEGALYDLGTLTASLIGQVPPQQHSRRRSQNPKMSIRHLSPVRPFTDTQDPFIAMDYSSDFPPHTNKLKRPLDHQAGAAVKRQNIQTYEFKAPVPRPIICPYTHSSPTPINVPHCSISSDIPDDTLSILSEKRTLGRVFREVIRVYIFETSKLSFAGNFTPSSVTTPDSLLIPHPNHVFPSNHPSPSLTVALGPHCQFQCLVDLKAPHLSIIKRLADAYSTQDHDIHPS